MEQTVNDQIDFDVEVEEKPVWQCCHQTLPATEIIFFAQIGIVYITVITAIINLSLGNEPFDLWITLLSSCLGYILPSPQMRRSGRNIDVE